MALNLVTGYKGKDHVTAEQWSDFNRGIFGAAAILPVGNKMEVAIQTANQITVKDGVAVFDGRQVYIGYGESENISITSGTQSRKRYDIVVVKYTREEETGIENVAFQVVTGTPTSGTPADPTYQDTDIRTGVFTSQKPFCRVRLNGTAIEGIDMLVEVKEFKAHAFADPVNNTTGTDQSLPLAAPVGKKLQEQIDAQNSAFARIFDFSTTTKLVNFVLMGTSGLGFLSFLVTGSASKKSHIINLFPGELQSTPSTAGVVDIPLGTADEGFASVVGAVEGENVRLKITFKTTCQGTITMLRAGDYKAIITYPTS